MPILPGSTLGILGSGQLGRMLALSARQMGYRVHTFSPGADTPTGQVADVETTAAYDDLDAVRKFARGVDVVTFEFENVPAPTAAACAEFALVRPGGEVLHTTQHRLREKTFLSTHGFPVTPFRAVRSLDEAMAAFNEIGPRGVIKTAAFGYDGKGQSKVASAGDVQAAVARDPQVERVFEAMVDFDRELSVVAARGADGSFAHWGAIENSHENHILDISIAPANVPQSTADEAVAIARGILDALGAVGVLCVEFFHTRSGQLLVNEIAPRPHNSGHLTIDACVTSQFEQQLRAVCGLPLGSTHYHRPAAMAQLLGDLWTTGEPKWDRALAIPGIHLHLYGKKTPKIGRKMGHLTALADTPEAAKKLVERARKALVD
jgi:5-(carboxyamino)imidazole ribonucleotide synthase